MSRPHKAVSVTAEMKMVVNLLSAMALSLSEADPASYRQLRTVKGTYEAILEEGCREPWLCTINTYIL
jgi:hypothetical protein